MYAWLMSRLVRLLRRRRYRRTAARIMELELEVLKERSKDRFRANLSGRWLTGSPFMDPVTGCLYRYKPVEENEEI